MRFAVLAPHPQQGGPAARFTAAQAQTLVGVTLPLWTETFDVVVNAEVTDASVDDAGLHLTVDTNLDDDVTLGDLLPDDTTAVLYGDPTAPLRTPIDDGSKVDALSRVAVPAAAATRLTGQQAALRAKGADAWARFQKRPA